MDAKEEEERRIEGWTVNDGDDRRRRRRRLVRGMHTYLATLLSSRATILAASCCDAMVEREFAEQEEGFRSSNTRVAWMDVYRFLRRV